MLAIKEFLIDIQSLLALMILSLIACAVELSTVIIRRGTFLLARCINIYRDGMSSRSILVLKCLFSGVR